MIVQFVLQEAGFRWQEDALEQLSVGVNRAGARAAGSRKAEHGPSFED